MGPKAYHINLTTTGNFNIPGMPVNQYMLIVKPSENLLERTKRIQTKWAETEGLQNRQLQSGYLLLARFSQFNAQEERLLRILHYAAMETAPYRINIEGFFGLPEHSIGLKISNPAPVKVINRSIQSYLKGLKLPGERPYFNQYPAIGMATKLEAGQYRAIWNSYGSRHFSAFFIAGHFLVLRKRAQDKGWSILERFGFENIPVQSKQGVLFA